MRPPVIRRLRSVCAGGLLAMLAFMTQAAASQTTRDTLRSVQLCVIQGRSLTTVTATYDPATGDTTVTSGQRFSEAYPAIAGYAASATWYISNEPITFNGQPYQRFGPSRVVGITEVTRAGEYQGVGVFTGTGVTGASEVIYVPVRPGCEFQPYIRSGSRPPAPDEDPRERTYDLVAVYYATDRARTGDRRPSRFYGGARGRLEYGMAEVSIPRRHETGALESPPWLVSFTWEDPSRHIVLRKLRPLERDGMFNRLRAHLDRSDRKAVLVFVHGYNVSFRDAARRTAQITHDLRFRGIPVMYSWPSDASRAAYTRDEADAEWSTPNFQAFLEDLASRSGAAEVHVIAHSMGNRLVTGAMRSMAARRNAPRLNQVVLTAPDIDAEVFARDIAPAIRGVAQRVTLYASSNDRALRASRVVHGAPRAGESGPRLVVVRGVDTIDASFVDTDLLGHSYFAQTAELIDDLFKLILHGQDPDSRRLDSRRRGELKYWLLPR
ncbi:MAG TPA: alpha/beta hydrolase [Longimicrobiaceae bacterium]|nr:alpha/beta hydrolase [Longimicrobiaceae bacterium]